MKLFKKLLSYIIAFTMVLSLATLLGGNVYAAGETAEDAGNGTAAKPTYTLTINNTKANHKYAVYKVFGGDLKVDSETKTKTLSNVEWGDGVNSSALLSALKADDAFGHDNANIFAKASLAKDVAEALAKTADESAEAKEFAQVVGQSQNLAKVTKTVDSGDGYTTVNLSDPGYYFVKDNAAVSGSDASTRFIVQVVGPAEVNVKSDVPTVVKKVQDKNDSTGDTSGWQDSADYDIGDWVPYQITGSMPNNIADYTTYKYEFTDTMDSGLTYNKDDAQHKANIKIGNKDVTGSFTENVANTDGKTTVTWTCNNLKGIEGVTLDKDTKVVVTYSAKLNKDAVIGAAGNPNEVNLTYSNNPNKNGEGETGTTPKDKNIVFTYKTVVNKVDKDNHPLKGAAFKLEKKTSAGTYTLVKELPAGDATTFEFTGLDDGNYKLTETTTPAGYNSIAPIEFTINATHDETSDDPKLTELSVSNVTGEATFTASTTAGSLTTNVVNKKGSELPSTGGMGTTLLYVAGGILVACAAAYVVLNKKRA